MTASEAKEGLERTIGLSSELDHLVHRRNTRADNLSDRCKQIHTEAAREIGFLDALLDRFARRVIPWEQDARPTDMFRKSLTIHNNWGSGILRHAIAELRIMLAKIEQSVNSDWSKELVG